MKILITGSKGMLGVDLVRVLKEENLVTGIDIQELDITNLEKCIRVVRELNPDWIVNSAAYTAVDDCESNVELAMNVNGQGAGNLAEAAALVGARLVHVSTDYVFNGTMNSPYGESDAVNPQTIYGESKVDGERRVHELLPDNYLIVRTSWLYGVNGNNFVETILGAASQGKPLRIVNDQAGCPTYTNDLAIAIYKLMLKKISGVVHITNSGATTWYEFAKYFLSKTYPDIQLEPVLTEEFPRPAKRPPYSVLSNDRLKMLLGDYLPGWRNAVDRYLEKKHPGLIKE
ncbi:dTDP-4-dehydrorhamnose reductase [bacterium]|nr:dTDP-4-dehydrorhamnose reductase [bacterium]